MSLLAVALPVAGFTTGATAGSTRLASPVRMSVSPRAARWKPGEVAPAHLTGALAGDAGFDPLLLAALAQKPVQDLLTGGFPNMMQREIILANQSPQQQQASVEFMREAEIKHARLAMLAVVGWPLAELINPWLGSSGGRAPSLFGAPTRPPHAPRRDRPRSLEQASRPSTASTARAEHGSSPLPSRAL